MIPIKNKKKRRTYIFAAGIVLAVVVIVIGIANQAGYVLTGGYLVRGATIIVEDSVPGSDVFLDNKRLGNTGVLGKASFPGIDVGEHTIIVAHESSWPWISTLTTAPGTTYNITPLQVRNETTAQLLGESTTPTQEEAESVLATYREPSGPAPLVRNENKIWIEGTQIRARIGNDVRIVLSSELPIRSLHWFNERDDAIVVSTGENVFALDARDTKEQNFLPIFQGVAPKSMPNPEDLSALFIEDDGQVFLLQL